MSYQLYFAPKFDTGIEKLRASPVLLRKIDTLLDELEEHPTTGIGKPEPMKGFGNRSIWSRRIRQKHRLVYEIFEEDRRVEILSCYGHYDDK